MKRQVHVLGDHVPDVGAGTVADPAVRWVFALHHDLFQCREKGEIGVSEEVDAGEMDAPDVRCGVGEHPVAREAHEGGFIRDLPG